MPCQLKLCRNAMPLSCCSLLVSSAALRPANILVSVLLLLLRRLERHSPVALVELVAKIGFDLLQILRGECLQQVPAQVEGREDVAVVVGILRQELLLKVLLELEESPLLGGQSLLSDDSLK